MMIHSFRLLFAAAICRRLYNRPGIGVGRFQTLFGGRASRGTAPEIYSKAAGESGMDKQSTHGKKAAPSARTAHRVSAAPPTAPKPQPASLLLAGVRRYAAYSDSSGVAQWRSVEPAAWTTPQPGPRRGRQQALYVTQTAPAQHGDRWHSKRPLQRSDSS